MTFRLIQSYLDVIKGHGILLYRGSFPHILLFWSPWLLRMAARSYLIISGSQVLTLFQNLIL